MTCGKKGVQGVAGVQGGKRCIAPPVWATERKQLAGVSKLRPS
jgi:hypothetical protein